MALLLAVSGSLFALLFALNLIFQTIRRAPRIGFIHTLLAFLTTLILLAALIAANLRPEPGPRTGTLVMAAAGLVAAPSLVVLLLELRRPERLKGSRGVFGLGVALLLAVGTISVPFTSAYTTLMAEPTATPLIVAAARTSTPAPTQTGEERARVVFITLVDIIAEQTGLDRDTIIDRLDAGISIAQMVAENGGDLDTVIAGISKVMRDQIEQLQAEGQVNRAQAALFLSQMDTFVRLAVNREWREGGLGAFLRAETTAEATAELPATVTITGTTAAPSPTPTPTATPTLTRTPRPTATPTPTRQRFATRTPAPTATLPTPCLALTSFNVNLRTEPSMDATILLTIPYGTTVTVFGRSADSTWWYGGYDEQAGWLKGEFLTLSASCADLPER